MVTRVYILAAIASPALFWAGAAAAAVPIVIHLLARRRFRRVPWAAINFLLEADRRNRRRVRIEELILLGLRCLIMLLIGALLARVFVQPEALASILGSKARTQRIVILDDSFSMGLKTGGEGTVFGQAKASVERLARWLREDAPDDSLTVLLTSRPDRPLRVESDIGKMDPAALTTELQGLAPSNRGGNMPATMEAVRHMLDDRKGRVNATVYVVSDFQRVDWAGSHGESAERTKTPAAALSGWTGRGRSLRILLVDTGVEAAQNLCVTAIEPQQAQAVAGVNARYLAKATNFGKTDSRAGSMQVFVGDAAQPQASVPPAPAGESVEIPLDLTFPSEGDQAISVQLDPDPLPVDNSRALAVPVARALRVLLVNGEASADPYQDEAFLLATAIRPEGPQFSGNDVSVVDEAELETADLATYHVVMLANVYRLTEEAAGRLERFAAGGGGVAVFMGDQVDTEIYNRILYRNGQGLLPAQLYDVISAPADRPGFGFSEIDAAQPLMRRFADAAGGLFGGVETWRFVAAEPAMVDATASAPERAASQPAPGTHARVLMRFDDPDKHPAIIERPFGNGRVVLFTTSADKEWTNLPERPAFVLLVMEMVGHLARPAAGGGEQLVGEPIRLRLDPARYRPVATLKPPHYPDEPAAHIEAQPDPDTSLPTIDWPQTGEPGLYRFELTETGGGEDVEQVAVNVDPRESDLRRVGRVELLETMAGLPVEYVAGEDLLRQRDDQARQELWPGVLIALVVVLMIEQALAVWLGSDRDWRAILRGRRP